VCGASSQVFKILFTALELEQFRSVMTFSESALKIFTQGLQETVILFKLLFYGKEISSRAFLKVSKCHYCLNYA